MSYCETCGQSLTRQKKDDDAVYQKARQLAQTNNKTYAIYRDGEGNLGYVEAEQSTGYPVIAFITATSPQL